MSALERTQARWRSDEVRAVSFRRLVMAGASRERLELEALDAAQERDAFLTDEECGALMEALREHLLAARTRTIPTPVS